VKIAVVGPSECGKTHLSKHLAREHMRAGRPVLVCDPLGSKWPAKWVTTDAGALMARAKASINSTLFIDESGLSFDRDRQFRWIAVTSRHHGHVVYMLMQDYTQLLPEMRKQCTQLYLFACHPDEAEVWAHQFPKSAEAIMKYAPHLNQYEFLHVEMFPKRPIVPMKLAA